MDNKNKEYRLVIDSPARQGLMNMLSGITGVLSLSFSILPIVGLVSLPTAVMAIVFGFLGKDQELRKFGVAGMIMGASALVVQILFVLLAVLGTLGLFSRMAGMFSL
ncbi:hypothetical protein GCM10010965_14930 [Caldalkalibacillus thermarum]|uniref:hypothetical protein n=1 Tax=Caldalkalibacillus thermarum TaxID=296745 RepID=UPI0016662B67|nr:hypothetical protein [Caldalkalibacillus thermarum]GGK23075.1 hypothetical protein GCM10010965_14930 [Caldalkalibacillus thermarum]